MSLKGALLGVGNPLLDISADVDQAFLDKYNVTMNNAILAEDKHQPIFKEIVEKYKVKYLAGGATLNSIRVAQWMSQAEGSTGYIGCVGKDKDGEQIKACCQADGVALSLCEDEALPTGTCACLILDKERSLVTNLSAANAYKKEHFDSKPTQDVLAAAKVVYSAGFFLTVSVPTLHDIGKHCSESGKIFAMNLSAPFIPQFLKDPLVSCIPMVDIMFGNESEAEAFATSMGYEDKSVQNVALQISKMEKVGKNSSRTVVITQGVDPTIVAKDGKVTEYPVTKIDAGLIVDSNGAGDAFVGGFLASLIKGKSEKECVEAGHYSSSLIIQVSGTILPVTAPDAKYA